MKSLISEQTRYTFPSPADAKATEWAGSTLAGAPNTITRIKGRTSLYDKTIDAKPEVKEDIFFQAMCIHDTKYKKH